MGSIKGCEYVNKPHKVFIYNQTINANFMNSIAPFDIEYRVIYAMHKSSWQPKITKNVENIVSKFRYFPFLNSIFYAKRSNRKLVLAYVYLCHVTIQKSRIWLKSILMLICLNC